MNGDLGILKNVKISIEFPQGRNDGNAKNQFQSSKTVCGFFRQGVVGIFGEEELLGHVQSFCNRHEVPCVATSWNEASWMSPVIDEKDLVLNLSPHPTTIIHALKDIMEEFGWGFYAILYESKEQIPEIHDLFTPEVVIRLIAPEEQNFRTLLHDLEKLELRRFLIYGKQNTAEFVLNQAQEVGMLTRNYSYLLSTLDFYMLPIQKYQHSGSTITGLQLINPEDPQIRQIFQNFSGLLVKGKSSIPNVCSPTDNKNENLLHGVPTEVILLLDAMKLFFRTLEALDSTQRIHVKSLNCSKAEKWDYGATLLNYIKMVPSQGLTGKINFNNTAIRTDVSLDVVTTSTNGGIRKLGAWNPIQFPGKFQWNPLSKESAVQLRLDDVQASTMLIVGLTLSEPFCMVRRGSGWSGNRRFEGYAVDVLEKVGELLNRPYIIRPVPKKSVRLNFLNSTNHITSQWTQLVEDVADGNVDLGIGDITITAQRLKFVDFVPFMHGGLQLIVSLSASESRGWFFLTSPFTVNVWIAIGIGYFMVSWVFFLVFKISPETPDIHSSTNGNKEIGFFSSHWLILTFLLRQKTENYPKTASSRMILISWSFFGLVVLAMYTSNLTSFFILTNQEASVPNLNSVINGPAIELGITNGGTTMEYFKNSPTTFGRKIWKKVQKNRKLNLNEGLEQVIRSKGKFGFIGESPQLEYYIELACELVKIPDTIHSITYGIAIRKESKLLDAISTAMLKLQDTSVLIELKAKWWKSQLENNICETKKPIRRPVRIKEISSSLILLVIGSAIGILMAVGEFFWIGRKSRGSGGIRERRRVITKELGITGRTNSLKKSSSLPSITGEDCRVGTPSYLDLGITSYGFPPPTSRDTENNRLNGNVINQEMMAFA